MILDITWAEAVDAGRRWLEVDPLHEPAHRCLGAGHPDRLGDVQPLLVGEPLPVLLDPGVLLVEARWGHPLPVDELTAIVDEVKSSLGRIDVLVHAGGIEISRKLSEKDAREFDLVFDIKADGFFSLLKAAEGLPIGATVVFSSILIHQLEPFMAFYIVVSYDVLAFAGQAPIGWLADKLPAWIFLILLLSVWQSVVAMEWVEVHDSPHVVESTHHVTAIHPQH